MKVSTLTLDLIGTGDSLERYQSFFLGYVPREEMPNCYRDAHVFVLPSYNESMSVAMLEAMASGLAIVTTNIGGNADLIKEGVNGFSFPRGDLNLLQEKLLSLSTDRSLMRKMGKASRQNAEHLTWYRISNQFMQLLSAHRNK
jgi:glycosyltransferase involved in cell wall biosynthesis